MTFYVVVTPYGIFYASCSPYNNQLYSKEQLPFNAKIKL